MESIMPITSLRTPLTYARLIIFASATPKVIQETGMKTKVTLGPDIGDDHGNALHFEGKFCRMTNIFTLREVTCVCRK